MEASPKISVIIPVYKVEPYLRQCLDSVVNQTYRNLEIILIDDGSPDNCGRICDEYAASDERITVIHKENQGLCAARNDGISRATGEWVTFADSDDWIDTDFYERMLNALTNDKADIVCSQGYIIEDPDKSVEGHVFEEEIQFNADESKDFLINGILVPVKKNGFRVSMGSVWDKFFLRKFLCGEKLIFDTSSKAMEDLLFCLHAFKKAQRVKSTMAIGYHYRMATGSITKSFNADRPQINYDFITKVNYLWPEPNDVIKSSLNARAIGMILLSLRLYYFHPANTKSRKEIAGDIKEMKTWPYYKEAIWSDDNHYLSKKQVAIKHILRLPWIWPLKLMYDVNEKLKKAG